MKPPNDHSEVGHADFMHSPASNDRHRLARFPSGSPGSTGTEPRAEAIHPEQMLATLRSVVDELQRREVRGGTPEEVRRWRDQAAASRQHLVELADAYEEALREEWDGRDVARRLERALQRHERRLAEDRSRSAGGRYVGERRSPNRPTQVEVDPEAWAVVKARAIRSRRAVAAVVGQLVVQSLDSPAPPLVRPGAASRSPAPTTARPRPKKRFARLFVDEQHWLRFRERAVRLDVPAGRLVGILVEEEALALGWRPPNRTA